MRNLMKENRSADVRAYFVWAPFLKADNEEAARLKTQQFAAPNSVYFWLPTIDLAWELASVLRLAAGRYAWDVYLLYKRGVQWNAVPPSPTYWQHQLEVLQGDKFDPQVMRLRIYEALGQ